MSYRASSPVGYAHSCVLHKFQPEEYLLWISVYKWGESNMILVRNTFVPWDKEPSHLPSTGGGTPLPNHSLATACRGRRIEAGVNYLGRQAQITLCLYCRRMAVHAIRLPRWTGALSSWITMLRPTIDASPLSGRLESVKKALVPARSLTRPATARLACLCSRSPTSQRAWPSSREQR